MLLRAAEDFNIDLSSSWMVGDGNETNQGSKQDGVMQNWFQLLEACDGQFAFHLNDRDIIDTHGIQELCAFLKENPTLTGGMCDLTGGVQRIPIT